VGNGHRADNNVRASLTFCVPIMRQMATSSIIAPPTATTTSTGSNAEIDNHLKVWLAFGDMQKNPKLKKGNNVLALSQNYEKWLSNSSCLYVCPFVRMEQLGSHWTNFLEIWHFNIFLNSVEKVQFSLIYYKNNC